MRIKSGIILQMACLQQDVILSFGAALSALLQADLTAM